MGCSSCLFNFLYCVLLPSVSSFVSCILNFHCEAYLSCHFDCFWSLPKPTLIFLPPSPAHKFPPVQHLSFCQPVAARLTQFSFHFFGFFHALLMQIQICMWHLRGKWKKASKLGTECPPFSGIELLSDSSLEKCDSLSVSHYSIDIQS